MGILVIVILLIVVFYCYFCVCVQKIAQKTNANPIWLAWVPIIQIILLFKIAGKSPWLILLIIVPIVNIIIGILLWVWIAKACNKKGYLGVLMMIPIVGFIVLGYLAFSE